MELRRQLTTDGNGWDRYYDEARGAAVVYENRRGRYAFGYINGVYFRCPWPDTAGLYEGDQGVSLGYRIRPDVDGHWYLYIYMYSGGDNRSEWVEQVA